MPEEPNVSMVRKPQQIDDLVKSLGELTEALKSKQTDKPKDKWDKFSALSPFVTGLIVAIVGGVFTYVESNRNELLKQQEIAQRTHQNEQDAQTREHQARILELQTIAQFMPYLTGRKEDSKQVAITAIKALSSTSLAVELARLNKSPGTIRAVRQIANQATNEKDRRLAQDALVELEKSEGGPNKTVLRTEQGDCGPEGAGGDSATNVLKNRTDVPSVFHDMTIENLGQLQVPDVPNSRDKWTPDQVLAIKNLGEEKAVRVQGFLIRAARERETSANCRLVNYVDWHLDLGPTPDTTNSAAIIAVAGPRIRFAHPNWTLDALRTLAEGKSAVRVSGWLFFDQLHRAQVGRFMATNWEVRPVVKIEYLEGQAWIDLDKEAPR
jgi:hypothetical protein